MRRIDINVDTRYYLSGLQTDLASHISDFRNSCRSVEDDSYKTRSQQKDPEAIIHITANNARFDKGDAIKRATENCFLAMTRSTIKTIDRIVAVNNLIGSPLKTPPAGTILDLKFVEGMIDQEYRNVASNTGLSNPKKLTLLVGLEPWINDMLAQMFRVRRALEHHGGFSDSRISLSIRRLRLFVGETELQSLPQPVQKGDQLIIRVDEGNIEFDASKPITFTVPQIEDIFFTLHNLVGPAVAAAVKK